MEEMIDKQKENKKLPDLPFKTVNVVDSEGEKLNSDSET